jgi:imidazolonepropionase-like amidohydrolase
MRRCSLVNGLLIALTTLTFVACSDDSGKTPTDTGPSNDAGVDGPSSKDGSGPTPIEECNNAPLAAAPAGTCSVTKGSGSATLLRGTVLAPDKIYKNGHVLIEGTKILCVGCDCSGESSFANATQIVCAKGVISPGLINPHDHIGWAEGHPKPYDAVYDHRHEWRKGRNGKPKLSTPGNATGSKETAAGRHWGEIRHLLAGTTSMMGSGTAKGLLRNLDDNDVEAGVSSPYADTPTFPLGDSGGKMLEETCDYSSKGLPDPSKLNGKAYVPHVAEGINKAARNEYLCVSGQRPDGVDVTLPNSTFIHAVGLTATDAQEMGQSNTGINWAPRSNISLYGMTADVVMLRNIGIKISLGTDWPYSGSISLLRELACVNDLNDKYYNGAFSAREIWQMVTANAADACGFTSELGRLRKGFAADIAIFDGSSNDNYAAVTRATVKEVALVMRGGKILYGDAAVVDAAGPGQCEAIDVCGAARKLCAENEIGQTTSALELAITVARKAASLSPNEPYGLFFCGTPKNEPSCLPKRNGEYTGQITADDSDGDGVKNDVDTCPNVFNPPRSMNDGKQPDTDGDKVGDECDPCPLDANTTNCKTVFNPNDKDGDGIDNDSDNCPDVANKDQADADSDKLGDACDPCPQQKGTCAYTIKQLRDKGLGKQPRHGTKVAVKGATVIAVRTTRANNYGFYIREGSGDFEAIFVFTRDKTPQDDQGNNLAVGDVIDIEAEYNEFNDLHELENLSSVKVTSKGTGDVTPKDVTTKDLQPGSSSAEALESQLVRVKTVTVAAKVASDDDFFVTDDGNACSGSTPPCTKVGDFFFDGDTDDGQPASAVSQTFTSITGVVNGFKNDHSLDPRDASDLQ